MRRSRWVWEQARPTSSRGQEDDGSERIDAGPFEPRLMLLERRILLGGGSVPVLVQIGQDAQMVTSAAREFGRELAIFLAILWLALSLAAWAQVALGLRPLDRKSVVQGKSVSVRVDIGGRRIIKKKKKQ